jgi:hypothetical protein
MYIPRPSEEDILKRLERIEKTALPIALFCTGLPFLAIGLFDYLVLFRDTLLGKPDVIYNEISGIYLFIGAAFLFWAFTLFKRRPKL